MARARRGELSALRWQHIDTTRGLLVIRSVIAQASGQVWEKDISSTSTATSR